MDPINVPIGTNITNVPTHLGTYVSNIVGAALMIAALAAFIFLVWGGIQWITAGGDKGKIEESRNRITGALVGLAVTAAAWAIFLLVDHFLGLNMAGNNNSNNTATTHTSNLGNFTGVAACQCYNGGCAADRIIAQRGGPNNCFTCTSDGWVATGGSCGVITCGRCP